MAEISFQKSAVVTRSENSKTLMSADPPITWPHRPDHLPQSLRGAQGEMIHTIGSRMRKAVLHGVLDELLNFEADLFVVDDGTVMLCVHV